MIDQSESSFVLYVIPPSVEKAEKREIPRNKRRIKEKTL